MPVGRAHHTSDGYNVLDRDILVKQVTHGIDNDPAWPVPAEWVAKFLGREAQVEAVLERMPGNSSEALGKSLGVTVQTPRTYLRAASHRIPRRVGPLDLGVVAHSIVLTAHGSTPCGLHFSFIGRVVMPQ
jgi:hypothetical protein